MLEDLSFCVFLLGLGLGLFDRWIVETIGREQQRVRCRLSKRE